MLVSHLWVCGRGVSRGSLGFCQHILHSSPGLPTSWLQFVGQNMTDLTLQVFVHSASEATIALQANVAQICHFLPICDLIFFFFPASPPQIKPRPLSYYSDIVLIQTHVFHICNLTSVWMVTLYFFQLLHLWTGTDVTILCWRRRGSASSNNAIDETSMVEHGDGIGPWRKTEIFLWSLGHNNLKNII